MSKLVKSGRPLTGTSPAVIDELKALAEKSDGLIRARDVVEAARPEDSPLHNKFEWDDSEAADKFRLFQARYLLSISIQYIQGDTKAYPTKVFVSLSTDRNKRDGEAGYRTFVDVIADDDMKNQLLLDSLNQMRHFEERYKALKELEGLLSHMRNTRKKLTKTVKR